MKIGIGPETGCHPEARGVIVRGIKHLSECLVAMFPGDFPDERCTCRDDSPEW